VVLETLQQYPNPYRNYGVPVGYSRRGNKAMRCSVGSFPIADLQIRYAFDQLFGAAPTRLTV